MNSGKLNVELSMTVPAVSKMRSLRERVLLWTGPFQKPVYVEPGDLVEERELPWESTRPRSDIFISALASSPDIPPSNIRYPHDLNIRFRRYLGLRALPFIICDLQLQHRIFVSCHIHTDCIVRVD